MDINQTRLNNNALQQSFEAVHMFDKVLFKANDQKLNYKIKTRDIKSYIFLIWVVYIYMITHLSTCSISMHNKTSACYDYLK